jgi:hypothetical protein
MTGPTLGPVTIEAWKSARMDHDSKLEGLVSTGILPADTDVRAVPRAGVSSRGTLPI